MKIRFKPSQKIRIIFRDVVIYTTVGKYAKILGTGKMVNATFCTLIDLQENGGRGLVRSYQDEQIQVDLLD